MVNKILSSILVLVIAINSTPTFAQKRNVTKHDLFQKVKDSIFLLNDGEQSTYGIYLAGARDKKFAYMLGLNQLTVGIENKIRLQPLLGKTKKFEAEKFKSDESLNVAIYKVKISSKKFIPITREPYPPEPDPTHWSFGSSQNSKGLTQLNIELTDRDRLEVLGFGTTNFSGLPIFDSNGRINGIITQQKSAQSYGAIAISRLLKFATVSFSGLDLFPIWKEVYPTQFAVEQVKASVALLDTQKPGAGIFLGRDKSQTGYILTANHVVGDDKVFSVQFLKHIHENILGQTMPETINNDLDLAVVKVDSCPPIKPVTFLTKNSLEKIERLFSPQTVSNIGYASILRDEDDDFFQHKFGSITKVTDATIETDLPLESGDSGGPVFNANAEVIGLNLKTELSSAANDTLSVANHTRTILNYLAINLKNIEFEEKWDFYYYPSFWDKNKIWLISGVAAVTAGVTTFLSTRTTEADLPKPPALP